MPEVETHKMTVTELKAALEGLGVENRSGLKPELVARLEKARSKKQRHRSGILRIFVCISMILHHINSNLTFEKQMKATLKMMSATLNSLFILL